MIGTTFLKNQFLIAMPNLGDPNFSRTVTYICQHNEEGALGIIINRPAELKLGVVFQQMDIIPEDQEANNITVFAGGPVQLERGFVIHSPQGKWDSTLQVSDQVSLTTSRDILEAIAIGEGPEKSLIALGYAGWGEGQMETEISANAWLNTPSDDAILFDLPISQRWNAAADQIGVDIASLTAPAGHG
jgi:putative transcriptional regulator